MYERTQHEKIFVIANANSLTPAPLNQTLLRLEEAIQTNDMTGLIATLQELLPGFTPWNLAIQGQEPAG